MITCPFCSQGTISPKYDEVERIHYSVCSFCNAEFADNKEIQLNHINRRILLLKENNKS